MNNFSPVAIHCGECGIITACTQLSWRKYHNLLEITSQLCDTKGPEPGMSHTKLRHYFLLSAVVVLSLVSNMMNYHLWSYWICIVFFSSPSCHFPVFSDQQINLGSHLSCQCWVPFATLDILPHCILSDKTCQMIPLCVVWMEKEEGDKMQGITAAAPRRKRSDACLSQSVPRMERYNCNRNQLLLVVVRTVKRIKSANQFLVIQILIRQRKGMFSFHWLTFVRGADPHLKTALSHLANYNVS